MARLLIIGGGCRALTLTPQIKAQGHVLRISTRDQSRRADIEKAGAECWIGTPDRLDTMRAALEGVTIACWLLGTAKGSDQEVRALHDSRLEFFLGQIIDTTVRGFIYERAGSAGADVLTHGAQIASEMTTRNSIPLGLIEADPSDNQAWLEDIQSIIDSMLGQPSG